MTAIVTSGAFMTALALAGASTLVTSLLAPSLSGGIGDIGRNFSPKSLAKAPTMPRQIIYGTTRASGTIVHLETTGSPDGHMLHMIIVVSGHPIESFEEVYYNDLVLRKGTTAELSSGTTSGETVYTIEHDDLQNTKNKNKHDTSGSLVRFTFHDGTQTAHDGFARGALGATSIPDTHKFINCAYFYFQLVMDGEKNNAIPSLSFLLKGKNFY